MSTGTLDAELLKAVQDESSLPRALRGVASTLVDKLQQTLSGTARRGLSGSSRFSTLNSRALRASSIHPHGLNPVMQIH